MLPTIIQDNFFEDPDTVRKIGLTSQFIDFAGDYPGKRTQLLSKIHPALFEQITDKIFSLYFNLKKDQLNYNVKMGFQYVPEEFEDGWIHYDQNFKCNVSGVIYLSPDAPLNSGTSLWKPITAIDESIFRYKNDRYSGKEIDLAEYTKIRNAHNSQFEKTLEVSNVYNRLFAYDASQWHSAGKFFGNALQNSRLTIVFFASVSPK
jgi:hypothetical protein